MKYTTNDIINKLKLLSNPNLDALNDNVLCSIIDGSLSSIDFCGRLSDITSIGHYAFRNCPNLALTSLPEGITSIGDYAFYNCRNLALTSLPEGLTSIGNAAFRYCISLTNLTFKGTPTSIDSSAFQNCTNLTIINVPWAEGEVANAPWGATNATINYGYVESTTES